MHKNQGRMTKGSKDGSLAEVDECPRVSYVSPILQPKLSRVPSRAGKIYGGVPFETGYATG